MALNKFEFIGNVAADPEQRIVGTNNDTIMTNIRIAVDRDRRHSSQEKVADFFTITTFGKLAGVCSKWLKKGREIYVSGRIIPTSYITKEGATSYTCNFIADTVDFLRGGFVPGSKEEETPGFVEAGEEDIPFN